MRLHFLTNLTIATFRYKIGTPRPTRKEPQRLGLSTSSVFIVPENMTGFRDLGEGFRPRTDPEALEPSEGITALPAVLPPPFIPEWGKGHHVLQSTS